MGSHQSHMARDNYPVPRAESTQSSKGRSKRRKHSSISTQRTAASRFSLFRSSRTNSAATASTSSSNSIRTPPHSLPKHSSLPFSQNSKPVSFTQIRKTSVEPTLRNANNSEVTWIGGRPFLSGMDLVDILPCDEEETKRLQSLHYMMRFAIQGNYLAPVSSVLRSGDAVILDAACGPGSWPVEIAGEYPKSKVIGVDILSPKMQQITKPSNCSFLQCDILQGIPYDNNTFDYIFMRFVAHKVQTKRWSRLINELVRTLKPGGWIELVEMDHEIHRAGPNTKEFNGMLLELMNKRGLDPLAGRRLGERLMDEPSLTKVAFTFISCPGGLWGGKLGQLTLQQLKTYYDALRPQICLELGSSAEEYVEKLKASWPEVDEYKTFANAHFAYAQKKST